MEAPHTTFYASTAAMLSHLQAFLTRSRPHVRMPAGFDPLAESRMPSSALAVLRALAESRLRQKADRKHPDVIETTISAIAERARLPPSAVNRALGWLHTNTAFVSVVVSGDDETVSAALQGPAFSEAHFQNLGPRFLRVQWPPGYAGPADMTWKAEAALHGRLWPASIPLNSLSDPQVRVFRAIGDMAPTTSQSADAIMPAPRGFTVSYDDCVAVHALRSIEGPPFPPKDVWEEIIRHGPLAHVQPSGLPLWTAEWQTRATVTLKLSPAVWMSPLQIRSVAWLGETLV